MPYQTPEVATLEHASHTAVPAARTGFDGPFLVRAFLGGTGRANAASALSAAPDPELAARIPRIEAAYARHGLAARFRSTPLDPPGLEDLLLARGYGRDKDSLVMAGPGVFAATDPAVEALTAPDEAWLSVIATAEYQTPARREEKMRAPGLMLAPAAWMLLRLGGRPAAAAQVTADGALAGLFDVAVHPDFRRRGLGRRVLGAAMAWAAERGAETAWLQVSAANAPAIALYGDLGLREVYRYRYFLRR
ncbi:GNAT family N-acetyltransferase [Roseomonas marmotae]|uniref:GNAT family N-acetyltransferase n=1 Tax=Roseomonas marmotae TaxID=2768161 RepID=A0ABS3KGK9_9PROT|nr:GNAT family N-acetyltransferase [Roseomonas marmotae]MBO1076599.1 GNAT family N-acetyltransferase [Roseomonas marmotae]QTI79583.1 GNAT family N-acetyltransferase [Roseomonas marmotae]